MLRIKELEAELDKKNSYYTVFKRDDAVKAGAAAEMSAETKPSGYDMVFEMDDETADRGAYC